MAGLEFLSASVFPPGISSFSQAAGSGLITAGEVCDRAERGGRGGGPQAFLAFVLHISELLELRVFTEEVKENDG